MKAVTGRAAGFAAVAAALVAVAACSSSPPASHLVPAGGGSSATVANGESSAGGTAGVAYVMPPFGKNVHIEMTSWLPSDSAQAQAVLTDRTTSSPTSTRSTAAGRTRAG